ncbi:Protein N-acetyltransferase, RimJ/RimL family [Monaibacterium marinum]|uniref:Protein N-acetyltransferase, RimJ/RimL family n=1 Tax=Pontivivens marinum TaxID=1690039 RepID=A0A2C9CYL1_9RHOB|nr:GNAT family N-acetyltransferase [Monaibacterium marinum]SOH95549.1 Protein N-acetyltransferase, RimJ/RimL family [Monaibacterium marinum]
MTVPVIETERLTLRPLRASDAGLITLYAGDARVARMTTRIPHPFPPGAAESFIGRALREDSGEQIWALDATKIDGEEILGTIALRDTGDVGYWIGPPFWRTGYASEALAGVISWHFAQGGGQLKAQVFQDNDASAAVLTSAGFGYVGEGDSYSVARGGIQAVWSYTLDAK